MVLSCVADGWFRFFFFFSSRRRHTRLQGDWSSDVCSSDLTEDKRVIGNARCSMMTPPAAKKDVPMMSGCMAEAKGMAFSVGSMSPTKEQFKTLVDKAITRLP